MVFSPLLLLFASPFVAKKRRKVVTVFSLLLSLGVRSPLGGVIPPLSWVVVTRAIYKTNLLSLSLSLSLGSGAVSFFFRKNSPRCSFLFAKEGRIVVSIKPARTQAAVFSPSFFFLLEEES